MAEIIADRVAETSATTATDTYSLAGAMTGFQSFADGIGNGNTCRYMITDNIDWEVGLGTIATPTPNTLTRDTIEASSNSGAKVSWSAGTKNIYHVLSAGKINTLAASGANSDITSMTGLSDDGIPIAKVSGALANLSEDTTPDLGGPLGVKENQIQLDATLSATTKYSGITCDIVIGYASAAFGDLVYLSNTDDRWEKTDANAEGTSGDVMLGIVISAGSSDGDAGVVMLQGFLKLTAWNFPLGGDALYVSETAGAMTATRPTTASTIVRVVGYAGVDADTVYFNPSGTWIETAA